MANILIIGNGFDLKHCLPTKYSDYLNQLKENSSFYKYVDDNKLDIDRLNILIKSKVCKHLTFKMNENKGWIDFENEVKEIIDDLSNINNIFSRKINLNTKKYYYLIDKNNLEDIPIFLLRYILKNDSPKLKWNQGEIKKLSKDTLEHIKLFIHFFEEYLNWILDTEEVTPISFFSKYPVDYLLSFNYTPTYEQFYNRWNMYDDEKRCYVHGEINRDHQIVMGIGSEFYDENIHEDYVELFKFYQRYKNETDCKYQEWIQDLEKGTVFSFNESEKLMNHTITIFGHSLDPTDKDILKPFLTMKNTKIKIYYHEKADKLKIEKNLLKILGRKLFEEYLTGNKKRIQLISSKGIE